VWLRRVFEKDCIDVGAIHCWGEFSSFFGFAPCNFAMASNMAGQPLVCEVDVCHAIMAKLGWALTDEPPVILDINNNGWDPRVFNVFHCSQTPNNWMCEKACITDYGSLEGMMAPGKFTGISTSTTSSAMKATVFQGAFLQRQPGQRGCSGWAFVPNNPEVLKAIEAAGIHHFVALKGQLGSLVTDALGFRGIEVTDLSCEVPDVGTIEDELPDPGSDEATGYRVYSE
jgi:L-fucose isomerase-like protein